MIAPNSGSMICRIYHQLPATFIKVSAQHFLVETRKKNSANELHPASVQLFFLLLLFLLDIPRNRPRSITIVLWIGISGTPEFGTRIHENKQNKTLCRATTPPPCGPIQLPSLQTSVSSRDTHLPQSWKPVDRRRLRLEQSEEVRNYHIYSTERRTDGNANQVHRYAS